MNYINNDSGPLKAQDVL